LPCLEIQGDDVMSFAIAGVNGSPNASAAASRRANDDGFTQVLASVNGAATADASTTSATSVAPRSIFDSAFAAQLLATPQEERDFASDLTRRLSAAGVDTSQPIQLQVQSDGSVVAKDGTPNKQEIDAVFAADPDLSNEYRKIANTEEITAIARVQAEYQRKAKDLDSAAQSALWQRYAAIISSMQAHSGELTLKNGQLSFDGQAAYA
jgi:hypothetical protein